MVARPQLTITRYDMQLSLMLQRMPPIFRAFMNTELPNLETKLATDLFYWKALTYCLIITPGILK